VYEKHHRSRILKEVRPIQIIFDIDEASRKDPFFPLASAAMNIARDFYVNRLKVLYEPNRRIVPVQKNCYEFDVPAHYLEKGFSEDLLIIFKVLRNESLPYRAASGDCELHSITNRPIVRLVGFGNKLRR
jgi:hypothetical protein